MGDYSRTLKSDESSLLVHYVYRPLAYPIAKAAHRLGITANQMTVFSGLCWIVSLPLFFLGGMTVVFPDHDADAPRLWGIVLLAAALWCIGTLLDVADGSLARLSGTASPAGFYLDYVFHLLFKPAFFTALALVTSFPITDLLVYSFPSGDDWIFGFLAFFAAGALLAPMLNWSAAQSSAEHVLCELKGKGKLPENVPSDVWLGSNDSAEPMAAKRRSPLRFLRAIAAECLSYYGQFTFFAVLVVVDFLLDYLDVYIPLALPCTTIAFWLLYIVFLVRLPFRIAAGFRRMNGVK